MKKCVQQISPLFNRCVIFNTDEDSFHGLPDPINCPDSMTRKSIALYYYTEEKILFFALEKEAFQTIIDSSESEIQGLIREIDRVYNLRLSVD